MIETKSQEMIATQICILFHISGSWNRKFAGKDSEQYYKVNSF